MASSSAAPPPPPPLPKEMLIQPWERHLEKLVGQEPGSAWYLVALKNLQAYDQMGALIDVPVGSKLYVRTWCPVGLPTCTLTYYDDTEHYVLVNRCDVSMFRAMQPCATVRKPSPLHDTAADMESEREKQQHVEDGVARNLRFMLAEEQNRRRAVATRQQAMAAQQAEAHRAHVAATQQRYLAASVDDGNPLSLAMAAVLATAQRFHDVELLVGLCADDLVVDPGALLGDTNNNDDDASSSQQQQQQQPSLTKSLLLSARRRDGEKFTASRRLGISLSVDEDSSVEKMAAHRAVLAPTSAIFELIVAGPLATKATGRSGTPQVVVAGIRPRVFRRVLHWLYTRERSSLHFEAAQDYVELLCFAQQYDCPALADAAVAGLLQQAGDPLHDRVAFVESLLELLPVFELFARRAELQLCVDMVAALAEADSLSALHSLCADHPGLFPVVEQRRDALAALPAQSRDTFLNYWTYRRAVAGHSDDEAVVAALAAAPLNLLLHDDMPALLDLADQCCEPLRSRATALFASWLQAVVDGSAVLLHHWRTVHGTGWQLPEPLADVVARWLQRRASLRLLTSVAAVDQLLAFTDHWPQLAAAVTAAVQLSPEPALQPYLLHHAERLGLDRHAFAARLAGLDMRHMSLTRAMRRSFLCLDDYRKVPWTMALDAATPLNDNCGNTALAVYLVWDRIGLTDDQLAVHGSVPMTFDEWPRLDALAAGAELEQLANCGLSSSEFSGQLAAYIRQRIAEQPDFFFAHQQRRYTIDDFWSLAERFVAGSPTRSLLLDVPLDVTMTNWLGWLLRATSADVQQYGVPFLSELLARLFAFACRPHNFTGGVWPSFWCLPVVEALGRLGAAFASFFEQVECRTFLSCLRRTLCDQPVAVDELRRLAAAARDWSLPALQRLVGEKMTSERALFDALTERDAELRALPVGVVEGLLQSERYAWPVAEMDLCCLCTRYAADDQPLLARLLSDGVRFALMSPAQLAEVRSTPFAHLCHDAVQLSRLRSSRRSQPRSPAHAHCYYRCACALSLPAARRLSSSSSASSTTLSISDEIAIVETALDAQPLHGHVLYSIKLPACDRSAAGGLFVGVVGVGGGQVQLVGCSVGATLKVFNRRATPLPADWAAVWRAQHCSVNVLRNANNGTLSVWLASDTSSSDVVVPGELPPGAHLIVASKLPAPLQLAAYWSGSAPDASAQPDQLERHAVGTASEQVPLSIDPALSAPLLGACAALLQSSLAKSPSSRRKKGRR